MSLNLLGRTLRDRLVNLIIYLVLLVPYEYLIVSIYPTVQTPRFREALKDYPEGLLTIFSGSTGGAGDLFSFEGFLAVEYLAVFWAIVGIAYVTAFATGVVTKEMENGTMELLLAQPVSRTRLLLTKMAALWLYLAIFSVVTVGVLAVLAPPMADVSVKLKGFAAQMLMGWLLLAAIAAYTFFFSALASERGKAVFASIGVSIAMWALNTVSLLVERTDTLKYFTLFHYYRPAQVLRTADPPLLDILVPAGLTLVFTLLALSVFRNRDITL